MKYDIGTVPDVPTYPQVPTSTTVPPYPGPYVGASLQYANNTLYVFSGVHKDDLVSSLLEQWSLNTQNLEWNYEGLSDSASNTVQIPKMHYTTWQLGNYLYIFGGAIYSENTPSNNFFRVALGSTNVEVITLSAILTGNYSVGGYPGQRLGAAGWVSGTDLYLFGGEGYGEPTTRGFLNDMWKYDTIAEIWSVVGGTKFVNSQDYASWPGGRSFTAHTGNGTHMWFFSGRGAQMNYFFTTIAQSYVQPGLWQYTVATNTWTELASSFGEGNFPPAKQLGGPSTVYAPSPRELASIIYINGSLYLFGGFSVNAAARSVYHGAVWEYDLQRDMWFWLEGSSTSAHVLDSRTQPAGRRAFAHTTTPNGMWVYGGKTILYEYYYPQLIVSDLWFIQINNNRTLLPPPITTTGISSQTSVTSYFTSGTGTSSGTTGTGATVSSGTSAGTTITPSGTTNSLSTSSSQSSTTSSTTSTTSSVPVCGNGRVETGEQCDSTPCCNSTCQFRPSGYVCGPSRGACDVQDLCTGNSGACPDITQPFNYICNQSTGNCTFPQICAVSVSDCPLPRTLVNDSCGICGGDGSSCTPRGGCGDGICFTQTENCSSCILDCGPCGSSSSTTCKNNCNGQGVCTNGSCYCSNGWGGPYCDKAPESNVQLTYNGTQVRIADGDIVYFSVKLRNITELDTDGTTVQSFTLDTQNISVVANIEVNGTKSWNYTISMDNGAVAVLHFILVGNSSLDVTFANVTRKLAPHTIKFSMDFWNWPFKKFRNRLSLTMSIDPDSSQVQKCSFFNSDTDSSGNTKWIEFTIDLVSLYGTFLDYAMIDQVKKPIEVKAQGNGAVVAFTLPHFWNSAVLDPDFTVLLSDKQTQAKQEDPVNPCLAATKKPKSKGINKPAIIAGTIVGFAALCVAVVVTVYSMRRRRNALMRLRSSSSKGVEMSRT